MILSMTGYGKSETLFNNKNISVEIRSLNSKNLDVKLRLPQLYREKEMEIRKLLSQIIKRGKVDVFINVEDMEDRPKNHINQPVFLSYLKQLKQIQPTADVNMLIPAVLRLPDVLQAEEEQIDEQEWETLKQTVKQAAGKLMKYREDEGASIEKDLRLRLENIRLNMQKIDELDKNRLDRVKERLTEALKQLKQEVDANRFEQELIYYLEKYDINEEKVRLNNHLDYFEQQLNAPEILKGKKLGFIAQEMGREINTTGSKANDSDIQQVVVTMKDELEKIKEQVLNAL